MIDLKFLRENPDLVKENIKKKFQDHKLPLVDEVIEYDKKAREAQQEADDLRAKKNQVSKQIGALMAQGKKEEAEAVKKEMNSDIKYKIGTMIEIPRAALLANEIAEEAEFFSFGTNDLTQYTIAVDRCNENVAYLYSAFNPAVLRLIRRIIECAHNAGIEAGMCGEAAANALMAPILLSFGLDEFSVSTGKVLETRKTIADWSLKEAGLVTDKVMSMATEKEVTDYLSDYLSERNKK